MAAAGRGIPNLEASEVPRAIPDTSNTQWMSTSNPQVKSLIVVPAKNAGDTVCHQNYLINMDPMLLESPRQSDVHSVGVLPLPDIMLSEATQLRPLVRRHKSTTDIPYSPYRGYFLRGKQPTLNINAETESSPYRRCSLRESSSQPCGCPRHALSVPNMSDSPQRTNRSPSRSAASTPVQEVEKIAKLRCKLLDDESVQMPTCPPETREELRYVSKDGKCRVDLGHISETGRFFSDIFTSFVDLQYRWFLFVFMMCYAVTWFLFAGLYVLDAHLRGDLLHSSNQDEHEPCYQNVDGFISALLFSVETQRTIGYGSRTVSPSCHEGVLLVMMQCIVGSMIDALMVGCMFVKISRPKKRAQTLLFSRTCVVAYRDDQLCLMFRLGDLRDSHMVDAKVRAKLIKSRQTAEGEFLPLEQSEINLGYESGSDRLFLVEPQIIQHTIDSSSPFWEIGPDQLRRQQFEIIVILEGIVEATGMMCQAKTSYIETEIEWGARFEPCITVEQKGSFRVDMRRFHSTFRVPLPRCSACEARQQHAALAELEPREEEEEDGKAPRARSFDIHKIQEEERLSEGNECNATNSNETASVPSPRARGAQGPGGPRSFPETRHGVIDRTREARPVVHGCS